MLLAITSTTGPLLCYCNSDILNEMHYEVKTKKHARDITG